MTRVGQITIHTVKIIIGNEKKKEWSLRGGSGALDYRMYFRLELGS